VIMIAVRAGEIFMTYNWWVTLNFAEVRNQQAALFGSAPKPLVWLMQDYEPAFMAFSSAHMLARAAYDTCGPLWGVINSSNLANYMAAVGHHSDRQFVFEPVIVESLRPFLDQVAGSPRQKRVLVYGRPSVERNCFPALVRGLRRWTRDYPEFADWEVISAGVPHDPVDLGGGRKLTSVGKLSLDEYAQMLLSCSAGVSLMASPHPSYPPLEMAHFGLRTVTNSYFCKDLSAFHPNILSVRSIAEADLAGALAEACRRSASPPEAFTNPEYMRSEPYPFMAELAEALAHEL
jgi:O-antigen biosynthesis protein